MKINYKETHGKDFKLPRHILRMVQDGLLEDVSYRNDAVPSFSTGADMKGRVLMIYVNQNDRRTWEFDPADGAKQFYVARWNPETDTTPEDLLITDSSADVYKLIQTHGATSPEMIAAQALKVFEYWLGKKLLREIANSDGRLNVDDKCDSNMAMDEAIRVFAPDYEIDAANQEQADLWNAAVDKVRQMIADKYERK
jgi:hypothetical protein